jgi:hypothetical protein
MMRGKEATLSKQLICAAPAGVSRENDLVTQLVHRLRGVIGEQDTLTLSFPYFLIIANRT